MNRREALFLLGKGLCAAAAAQTAGCSKSEEAAAPATVDLDTIPEAGRIEVDLAMGPVELTRSGGEVRARSLWCTHFGCRVRWSEPDGHYLCPCHEGRFDAEGRPVAGPPTTPLRSLPVSVVGAVVTVEDA